MCSATLKGESLRRLKENIPIIIFKLERMISLGFFDSMEHLPIHLPNETLLGGPVKYRWMYPFKRWLTLLLHLLNLICIIVIIHYIITFSYKFMGDSKRPVKNKVIVE